MKTLKEMMNLIELPEIVQTELLSIESTCALQKKAMKNTLKICQILVYGKLLKNI